MLNRLKVEGFKSLSEVEINFPKMAVLFGMERCRRALSGWRTYYLDPRVSMRREAPPKEVHGIGMLGEDIAPFLFRLNNGSQSTSRP